MRLQLATAVAALLPAVLGFKDTSPLIIYSPKSHGNIEDAASRLRSSVVSADEAYATISNLGCDWNDIVFVHACGLHQSHFSGMNLLGNSDLHIPYVKSLERHSVEAAINGLVSRCHAFNGGSSVHVDTVPDIQDLPSHLKSLDPYDLLIVAGSPSPTPQKRQDWLPFTSSDSYDEPEDATTYDSYDEPAVEHVYGSFDDDADVVTIYDQFDDSEDAFAPVNTTLPTDGPLLKRAQFFTAPIITALLISFGILLPILFVGINSLISIQVPPRMMEIGKGLTVGKERKDQ